MKDLIRIGKLIDLDKYMPESQKMDTVHISDIEGKEIIILDIDQYTDKKYRKKGVKAKIHVDDSDKILFTTAKLVVKQLIDIYAKLLVNKIDDCRIACRVQKIDKMYYKLTD